MATNFKIRLSVDVDKGDAENQVSQIIKSLEQKQINLKFNTKDLENQLKNVEKVLNNAFKLDQGQLQNLQKIKDVLQEINKLSKTAQNALFGGNINNNVTKFSSSVESAEKKLSSLQRKMDTLKNVKGFLNFNGTDITADVNRVEQELTTLQNRLKQGFDLKTESGRNEFKQLQEQIKQCESELQRFYDVSQRNAKGFKLETNIDKTKSDLEQLRQKCIDLGASTSNVERLENELRQLSNLPLDEQSARLQRIRSEMQSINSSLGTVGNTVKRTNTFFTNLYSSLAMFSVSNMLAMELMKGISSVKDTIIELDSAFRDLSKVAPESFRGTTEEFDALHKKAIQVGQEVARSSVDIINSTASALQAGFKDIDSAMEYAKNVNMYANVAETILCLCS